MAPGGGDISAEVENVERYLSGLEQAVVSNEALFNRTITPAAVRWRVTQIIIWTFAIYIGCMALYIFFAPMNGVPRFTVLLEILKSALLPVVTFVIGHYFGSKTE